MPDEVGEVSKRFLSSSTVRTWAVLEDWGLLTSASRYDATHVEDGTSTNSQGREQYATSDDLGRVAGRGDSPGCDVVVHPRAGPVRRGVNPDELPRARRFAGLRPFYATGFPHAAAVLCRAAPTAAGAAPGCVPAASAAPPDAEARAGNLAGGTGRAQAGGTTFPGRARHSTARALGPTARARESWNPSGVTILGEPGS